MSRSRPPGFTLVEMVISIVVVCIISALLAQTLRQAFDAWATAGGRKELLQETRAILLRAERELGQTRDRGSLLTAGTASVLVRTCADSSVGFSWNGAAGAPLLYLRNGRSYRCAAVDSFALAYWREDGAAAAPLVAPDSTDVRRLTVYLRLARGGQKVALRQAIALRNGTGG